MNEPNVKLTAEVSSYVKGMYEAGQESDPDA